MADKVRAHAIISGRVQGVCYRMETQDAAERFGVSGWVKNKPEGTVEAVFEGDQTQVSLLIQWCEKGPPFSQVDHVEVIWEAYAGEYKGFDITF